MFLQCGHGQDLTTARVNLKGEEMLTNYPLLLKGVHFYSQLVIVLQRTVAAQIASSLTIGSLSSYKKANALVAKSNLHRLIATEHGDDKLGEFFTICFMYRIINRKKNIAVSI